VRWYGRMGERKRRRRQARLRVPGADADAVGECRGECTAAAAACPRRRDQNGRGGGAGARPRRSCRFLAGLSARTVRRHEDARLDRARAGDRAAAAVDGRAVRRARRDHPLPAQQRPAGALARAQAHGDLRHPFGFRIGLSVAAHRGHDAAPRPRVCGTGDRRALSARRALPHLGGVRRLLPQGVGSPGAGDGSGAMNEGIRRIVSPLLTLLYLLILWEGAVRFFAVPAYVLPAPSLVLQTLFADAGLLFGSLVVTLGITFEAFVLAALGGIALAIVFNLWRPAERSLYPFALVLQVTPIVAIAPLLLIYLPQNLAVLACAWIVAFFPVLAYTTLGLNSVDHNLIALFDLYKASRWQVLWNLKLPAALPQILAGLRIAGGLSLIGAVVAEIAADSAGAGSGLAYRIAESGYRLNIPRMFAALLLLSLAGIAIFFLLSAISYVMLRRWHES